MNKYFVGILISLIALLTQIQEIECTTNNNDFTEGEINYEKVKKQHSKMLDYVVEQV